MNRLKRVLNEAGAISAPGIHDALTARIAEQAGHRALYLGGNAMALGLGKGQPFVTLTETAELVRRVRAVSDLALLVDAGAGFGELPHLDIAVREIEQAGADGLHIDDQPYPKLAGYHRGRGRVVETGAMAARLRTAAAARRNPDTVIVARTDALRVTGSIAETAERCRACVAAGADAVMVLDLGPENASAVRAAIGDVSLLWIGGVHPPVPTRQELAEAGFAMACYPFNGIAALTVALTDLWSELVQTGVTGQEADVLARGRAAIAPLSGLERAWEIEDSNAQI